MSATFTITKAALTGLFDQLPNPDDPGPWGPIGPVIRNESWVLLNPQPLPLGPPPDPWRSALVVGPLPEPWRSKAGPHPDPWRSALLTRLIIDEAVGMARWAETAASEERTAEILSSARLSIRQFVDEYCGTVPQARYPKPLPWPLKLEAASNPLELVIAGAQFQKVATGFDNPLTADFARAADILFETGFKRLAEVGGPA